MSLRLETWAELVSGLTRRLEAEGIDSARADVEQLAAGAADLELSRVRLLCALGDPVPAAVADRARRLAARRGTRVPLQHLLGEAPFGALRLAVGPGVLAPRPETELLAEAAVAATRARERRASRSGRDTPVRVVDVGTGTGAIALAVAAAVPSAEVIALEPDPVAFTWARTNLRRYPALRVRLVRAIAADLPAAVSGRVDVLVSNPPYVPAAAIPADPEAREFDPAAALYAGADGLDVIRTLVTAARTVLAPDGVLLCEHGEEQGRRVRALCAAAGLAQAETRTDLTGRDRFTVAAHVRPRTMAAV
jgi:release factor glutamine methyltransferase